MQKDINTGSYQDKIVADSAQTFNYFRSLFHLIMRYFAPSLQIFTTGSMGIVFRQSAKNLVVVVAGATLGALLIWLSTKFNSKQQFGSISNLTKYAVTFSQILLFGLNNTLFIFIHRYDGQPRKKKLLITICLGLPTLIAGLFSIVFWFLRTWILHFFQPADVPFMQQYFMWIPAYTFFFIYMVILEQYLGSQMKVAVSAFMREVVVRVANIILLLLFGFGYVSFHTLVTGTILIYSLPFLIFTLLALRTEDFGISLRFHDMEKSEYREIFHFTWYHFLLTISILMMSYLDALLLPFYDHSGFSSLAVYGVAIFFISFLQLPLKAMIPASFAVLSKAFAENDLVKAKDIFIRASVNILIPTVGVAILLICNLENAVAVIKNGYSQIIPVFMILFAGTLVNVASGMNDQVLSITNYYKFNFYLSLIIMVILFFMLRMLIPRYGVYGAAAGTSTALSIFSIIKCVYVWKKTGMQPYSRNTGLIFIAALPALAAGHFFPYYFEPSRHVYVHSFMDAIMRCSIITVIYVGMLIWLKPSRDLVEYLAAIRKNKRLF